MTSPLPIYPPYRVERASSASLSRDYVSNTAIDQTVNLLVALALISSQWPQGALLRRACSWYQTCAGASEAQNCKRRRPRYSGKAQPPAYNTHCGRNRRHLCCTSPRRAFSALFFLVKQILQRKTRVLANGLHQAPGECLALPPPQPTFIW